MIVFHPSLFKYQSAKFKVLVDWQWPTHVMYVQNVVLRYKSNPKTGKAKGSQTTNRLVRERHSPSATPEPTTQPLYLNSNMARARPASFFFFGVKQRAQTQICKIWKTLEFEQLYQMNDLMI